MNELLKVVIVDDESLTRRLLRDCINWEENGYKIVADAASAQEALIFVEDFQPDIIFTDINMPFMNGLEFSKIVLEQHPETKVIILTGYEEFDFARESVKIGISDFLLKPISREEIVKLLKKIKIEINSEKDRKESFERMKLQLNANLPYLRERLLNQLIQSSFSEKDILQKIEYFNVKINAKEIQIAAIEADDSSLNQEENLLLKMQCKNMVEVYFDSEYISVFTDNNQNTIVLNSDSDIDLNKSLDNIRLMLKNKLKCNVSIGIGNKVDGIIRIRTSYRGACEALRYNLVVGKNHVIDYSDINLLKTEQFAVKDDFLDTLSFYLKTGMDKKLMELIEEVFDDCVKAGPTIKIDYIRGLAFNILSIAMNVINELGIKFEDIFEDIHSFDKVFGFNTLPEVRDFITIQMQQIIDKIKSTQNTKVNTIIVKVKDYIDKNFSDHNISLTNTANTFYINISHLSRIFKQETGQTFVKYLTKVRMEKAIELLKKTNMKAYQIADAVGISDPHYFGICFKKYIGMTVNQFKKSDTQQKI